MFRYLFPLAVICFLVSPALADDAPKKEKTGKATEKTPLQKLKEDPNDKASIIALVNAGLAAAGELVDAKPDEAAKKLNSLKDELEALKADKEDAKELLAEAKTIVASRLDQLEILRTPLADLEKRLDAKVEPTTLPR
jgi:uncharacterized alpha-E superfamily protein